MTSHSSFYSLTFDGQVRRVASGTRGKLCKYVGKFRKLVLVQPIERPFGLFCQELAEPLNVRLREHAVLEDAQAFLVLPW